MEKNLFKLNLVGLIIALLLMIYHIFNENILPAIGMGVIFITFLGSLYFLYRGKSK